MAAGFQYDGHNATIYYFFSYVPPGVDTRSTLFSYVRVWGRVREIRWVTSSISIYYPLMTNLRIREGFV